jgi:ATP-dependent DNA helicase RecG
MNETIYLDTLKGVGPVVQSSLSRLGLNTIDDLIQNVPRRYDDYSKVVKIIDARPGKITIKARVEKVSARYTKRRLHITEAVLTDDSSKIKAVWFNQPYLKTQLDSPEEMFFSGEFALSSNQFVLQNPSFEKPSSFLSKTSRILPIYREAKGLSSLTIRKLMGQIRDNFQIIKDILPENFGGIDRKTAFYYLHFPENQDQIKAARDYLAFEELFILILASQLVKSEQQGYVAPKINFDVDLAKEFTSSLGFELTDAQRKVCWEIVQDLEQTKPTNRLVEGDVGSGKTAVAGFAALQAVRSSGLQVCILAPTEILARQHYESFTDMLEKFDVKITLLLGGSGKAKNELLKDIADNKYDIMIGTHALLQNKVDIPKLGLLIIDEQHRFGVKQRQNLSQKGKNFPHLISMTATPIPRSLALTVFGELDVSIIDQMPPGRLVTKTKLCRQAERLNVYAEIDQQIESGHQVYVVCPLIADNDSLGLKSVETEVEILRKDYFKNRRIAMLHGKLKPQEKESILQDFAAGEYDILVSTTVVEVGINVVNATVMLVEGCERFGLAQLHQLRGRIGRAADQSYCYLFPTNDEKISKRLKAITTTNDGFKLAEMDLELRGAGSLFGFRQHGDLDLRFSNLTDVKLIKKAQKAVYDFLETDDLLKYKELNIMAQKARTIKQLN